MEHSTQVTSPVAKAISLWALIGVTSWAEAASFVAFVYSSVLLMEWLWKRIGRKLAVRYGLMADEGGLK